MAIEYILYKLMSSRTISLHIVGNRGRIKEFPSSLYSTGTQRSLTEIYDRLYAKGPMSSSPFSPSHPGNVLVLSVICLLLTNTELRDSDDISILLEGKK